MSGADRVSVFAPATVANVGPGFDAFGFALDAPGDVVHAALAGRPGIHLTAVDGDGGRLPRDPAANTAVVAFAAAWERLAARHPDLGDAGVELRLEKGLPPCSGLGSSAASAAAGAQAAVLLAGSAFGAAADGDVALTAAIAGERVASGGVHADNVAPALLGGFTIVLEAAPPSVARFEPALSLHVAVVTPAFEIPTRDARASLPSSVPLSSAVRNWAHASALVLGLVRGDADLVARALVDAVVEPYRARLIPGFEPARAAARAAGALGCSISGAGPTLFALATTREAARAAGAAIASVFHDHDLASTCRLASIDPRGARQP